MANAKFQECCGFPQGKGLCLEPSLLYCWIERRVKSTKSKSDTTKAFAYVTMTAK